MTLAVSFFFVLFEHCSRRYLFGAAAITSGFFRAFL
jgi:hypothetical protein